MPPTGRVVRIASVVRVAGHAASPIDDYVARRHRQYMAVFVAAGAGLTVLIAAALWYRRRGAVGVGFAALGALGMGAMLQFSSATGMPALLWPPPRLWLGTFAGDFMLAVMCAAIAGVLLRPGVRRLLGSIVIAEAIWWTAPGIAAAAGLTLSIAEPHMRMDWLVFVGTAVGGVAAPAAAWSIAALAAALADRMVPRRAL